MIQNTIRRMPSPSEAGRMTTGELRDTFLLPGLFSTGEVNGVFTDLDRLVVGGIVPSGKPVELPNHRETGRLFFLEQRELGAINTGGPGAAHIDGKTLAVDSLACVYVGAGARNVAFESEDPDRPAKFFILSCPAHAAYPSAVIARAEAAAASLGSQAGANQRVIRKYIHPGGIRSCQLVMGCTELAEGSVWNTFPPHTHHRRTEVYFYFDLGERVLVHFLGEPAATRHLFIQNEQAALSPPWSIHAGCGSGNYKFIWGMAGENQNFDDMDSVKPGDLR
jgi:4-deoxy-L-threo-5-hexosulose-uronate ketol-isomerase